MERFTGILGIILILSIAFLFSNNKRRINLHLVFSGLGLQLAIAILVLKVPAVNHFFQLLGKGMQKGEGFAKEGASFVYGGIGTYGPSGQLVNYGVAPAFVFAFNVTATIILVCILVAIFYHFRIMQFIISLVARAMNF